MAEETILAVGAAGKFAGMVVSALTARGAKVRGLVRDEKKGDVAKHFGAAEIAIGDLSDPASLDAALKGVTAVFHIGPAFAPQGSTLGQNMVEAAKRAGVRKFVYSSVIHPTHTSLPNHRDVGPVEEAVFASGMTFAILQPAVFFQNIQDAWQKVVETGAFAEPYSVTSRFARVDFRDIADVAAIALLEDRLDNGTYELSSSEQPNRVDIANIMSEVLGRKITPQRIDPKQIPGIEGGILKMFAYMDEHNLLSNSLTLRTVLGREPRTLRMYIEELASTNVVLPDSVTSR